MNNGSKIHFEFDDACCEGSVGDHKKPIVVRKINNKEKTMFLKRWGEEKRKPI